MVIDEDNDLTTPLVGNAECAYTYSENGITLCAIEKSVAGGQNRLPQNRISCHLYPIRVVRFSNGTAGAQPPLVGLRPGPNAAPGWASRSTSPLREPIVRRFGEEFYKALEAAVKNFRQQ